jgi:hypothetical protein
MKISEDSMEGLHDFLEIKLIVGISFILLHLGSAKETIRRVVVGINL